MSTTTNIQLAIVWSTFCALFFGSLFIPQNVFGAPCTWQDSGMDATCDLDTNPICGGWAAGAEGCGGYSLCGGITLGSQSDTEVSTECASPIDFLESNGLCHYTFDIWECRPHPTADVNVSKNSAYIDEVVTLDWSSTNATSCEYRTNSGAWTLTSLNGSIPYTVTGAVWVEFRCSNAWGTSPIDSASISINSCQSSIPANASAWDAEEGYVQNNTTNWSYSASDTAMMCQYACNSGYTNSGGICTQTLNTLIVSKDGTGQVQGTITASPAGANQSINCGSTCNALYVSTTTVTITATANSGVVFTGWTGGGCSGSAPTCVVTMDTARNTTATFVAPNLTSDMTPTVTGTLTQGQSVTFNGRVRNAGTVTLNNSFGDNFTYCWGLGCSGWSQIGDHVWKSVPFSVNATQNDSSSPSLSLTNSGRLRVQHCVDSFMSSAFGQVYESNETDNCRVAEFDVNSPPTVNAGPDKAITLPVSTSAPTGTSATDAEGAVTVLWTNIGGPLIPTITGGTTLTPTFTNMTTAGTYTFRLTGTDSLGLTAVDDMQVVVNSALPNLTSDMTPTVTGTLFQGQNVTFNGRVRNSGIVNVTTTFSDTFSYRWGVSGAWISHSTHTVSASGAAPLIPNDTRNNSSSLFSLTNSGTLQIRYCVDSGNVISNETDESDTDNCGIESFTVIVPSCIGSIPSNSSLCSGDDTGLSGDVARTLVSACTAVKCEYTCASGYALNAGICKPLTPINLTATPQACGTGQVYLDWDDVASATSYSVYDANTNAWIGNSIGSNYTHTGSLNTAYSYYVRANDGGGIQSPNSSSVSDTTLNACLACGTAHNSAVVTQPSSNLCSVGAVSWTDILGSDGAYNWQCTGVNSGSVASCIANKITGSITAPDCTIVAGGSDCSVSVSWTSTNIATPRVHQNYTSAFSSLASNAGMSRTLTYGMNTFELKDNITLIASDTATASCVAGTTWNGSTCALIPPPTPTVTATAGSCGTAQINVSWSASAGATVYALVQSTSPTFTSTTTIYSGPDTSYVDASLTPGTTYYYRARAGNGSNSPWSDIKSATAPTACVYPNLVPEALTVPASAPAGTSITISGNAYNNSVTPTGIGFSNNYTYQWGGTGGAWKDFSGAVFNKSALLGNMGASIDLYSFATTTTGNLYIQYCVDAVPALGVINEGGGESDNCAISTSITIGVPPPTPINLTATPQACGTGQINVSWSASAGATSYTLRDGAGVVATTTAPTVSYSHSGLSVGSAHTYTVRANNAFGNSAYSSAVNATAPIDCACSAGVSKTWTDGGNSCTGSTPATASGADGSITDSTLPTTGSAAYLCTNGTWAGTPNGGATCLNTNLTAVSITASPSSITQGQSISLSGVARNNGTANISSSFNTNMTYQWGGTSGTWQSFAGNTFTKTGLSAGGTASTDAVSYTPTQSGTIYFQYCVDSSGGIFESDETSADNCEVTAGVVVIPPVCTGAIPSNSSLCSGDDTGLSGDVARTLVSACTAVKCEYTCASGYAYTAGACTNTPPTVNAGPDKAITLPVSTSAPTGTSATDAEGAVTVLWTNIGGPLIPTITGGTTLTPTFTNMTTAGTYTFRLTGTDSLGLTAVDDMQVVVGALLPDLIPLGVTHTSGELKKGSTAVFMGSTQNTSLTPTPTGFSTRIEYRWGLSGAWTSHQDISEAVLAGGITRSLPINPLTLSNSGTLQIRQSVDSGGVISESDETNNSDIKTFTILAPECSDGVDNDGDTDIDFGDDPGCDTADDDSEEDRCPSTQINNCELDASDHNETSGSCDAGGSCEYTCDDGDWEEDNNSCLNPTMNMEICDQDGSDCATVIKNVAQGETVRINWNSTDADFCTVIQGAGLDTSNSSDGYDDVPTNGLALGQTYPYTIGCGNSGVAVSDTVNLKINANDPEITSDKRVVASGQNVTLTVRTNGQSNCVLSGGQYNNADVTSDGQEFTTQVLSTNTTYTVTCDGDVSDSVTIEVIGTGFET